MLLPLSSNLSQSCTVSLPCAISRLHVAISSFWRSDVTIVPPLTSNCDLSWPVMGPISIYRIIGSISWSFHVFSEILRSFVPQLLDCKDGFNSPSPVALQRSHSHCAPCPFMSMPPHWRLTSKEGEKPRHAKPWFGTLQIVNGDGILGKPHGKCQCKSYPCFSECRACRESSVFKIESFWLLAKFAQGYNDFSVSMLTKMER